MKKWYFKLKADNIIEDVIEYPHEGYIEVELAEISMTAGVNGGWWKLENGQLVEYPELKPVEPNAEVEALKAQITGIPRINLESASLDEVKAYQTRVIKKACYDDIVGGFDSTVKYGELRHFSLDTIKQTKISIMADQLQKGLISVALWHDDSKPQHDIWSAAEFLQFYQEGQVFIAQKSLKSDSLEARILSTSTKEETLGVTWDTELTQDEINFNNSLLSAMFSI